MKILLVEDEEKLAQSVKKGLEQEGYVVDWLSNGEHAERRVLFDKNAYDLVLLDIMIPGKSGLELSESLRKAKVNIPILMLTARDTKEDIVLGLNAGADDYLVKPFYFRELLARISALLRRPKESFSEILEARNLKLDLKSKEAYLSGKKINLTQKEYNILEFLMRHKGEVVSRETLLSNVWDFEYNSFSNVVDVHMKNLRKKINKKNDVLIETIRGMGYKIEA